MVLGFSLRVLGRVARGLIKPRVAVPLPPSSVMVTSHRCRLVDVDFFWHQNNAAYLRCAELSRWELMPRLGLLQRAAAQGWMFLVAEQTAQYLKPIPPFARFEIRTTSRFEGPDGKWLVFDHEFVSPCGREVYCKASVKAIVKAASGKTVKRDGLQDFFVP